ncbi:MAG: alanine:cation symporter family protein [Lachnospiraceae bacterium]|nr:alanine:cation symporter family protein [Lachnospiraceae bacterium]
MRIIISAIEAVYTFLWGDLVTLQLPGGLSFGLPLLVIILIPTGIFFTVKTRVLPIRLWREIILVTLENKKKDDSAISGVQALIVSTATRVGMGNLAGVVAAISAGGAGAVFWMWITAIIGSSTAFAEAVLAQQHKQKDPIYGGYRGGPAYYIHDFVVDKIYKKKKKRTIIASLFALSGLICWFGISQVIGNSVSSAFETAFKISPIYSTTALVIIAAFIVLRKNATVKVLDIIVPVMAGIYFFITLILIIKNITVIPEVFSQIFAEAFGFRQAAAGGFGAVIMNGVKRGLFSNEAGSGSAPCAAAAADIDHPVKMGLSQAFGVFIDTIVICSCTAFIILMTPKSALGDAAGMNLMQAAMNYHLGYAGEVFIAVILWLFSFSTFIGILFYARSNIAYLFGDKMISQIIYKIIALAMLFVGGLSAYSVVWDLGDVGIGLMTIFNVMALIPMSGDVIKALKDYEQNHMKVRSKKIFRKMSME